MRLVVEAEIVKSYWIIGLVFYDSAQWNGKKRVQLIVMLQNELDLDLVILRLFGTPSTNMIVKTIRNLYSQ